MLETLVISRSIMLSTCDDAAPLWPRVFDFGGNGPLGIRRAVIFLFIFLDDSGRPARSSKIRHRRPAFFRLLIFLRRFQNFLRLNFLLRIFLLLFLLLLLPIFRRRLRNFFFRRPFFRLFLFLFRLLRFLFHLRRLRFLRLPFFFLRFLRRFISFFLLFLFRFFLRFRRLLNLFFLLLLLHLRRFLRPAAALTDLDRTCKGISVGERRMRRRSESSSSVSGWLLSVASGTSSLCSTAAFAFALAATVYTVKRHTFWHQLTETDRYWKYT